MQTFIVIMLLAATLNDYLVRSFGLPRELLLIPEILSGIALIIVTVRLPKNRFQDIDPRYLAVFGLLLLHLVSSAIINHIPPGVAVSAARIYLKAIPFFFIPLLLPMTEKNLKWQLLAVAAVCLIQFPIAFQQRSTSLFHGSNTGDRTTGTLIISSIMSVFLCCAASVAMAMYLKGKLKIYQLVLYLTLTMPATMINETKATLVLAPFALLAPAFLANDGKGGNFVKRNVITLMLVTAFLGAFIPTYDAYMKARWGYGIIEFIQMDNRVSGYLMKNSDIGSKEVGRIDSLILPFVATRHDPVQGAFGFGPGNVSRSSLGPQFTGAEYARYGDLVGGSASQLLWEIGWVGLGLILYFFTMVIRDAFVARKADGFAGALGLGWIGVASLIFITFFYNRATDHNSMSYCYWYFSGVVVATAMRVRAEQAAIKDSRVAAPRRPRLRAPQPAINLQSGSAHATRRR